MAEWLIDELSVGQSTLQNLLLKHDSKTRIICFLATLELIRLQYVYETERSSRPNPLVSQPTSKPSAHSKSH